MEENKAGYSLPKNGGIEVVIIGHHDNYLERAKARLASRRIAIAAHLGDSFPLIPNPEIEHVPEPIRIALPYCADLGIGKPKRKKPLAGRFTEKFKNKIK
jgi:hypothetical protein